MDNCLICNRIKEIKIGTNPYLIKELTTGYVVLGDYQLFKGYTLFLCKIHTSELHELNNKFKTTFLQEMSIVAEAVFKAFTPEKLNYELLGNTQSHLHWHIFPRYKNDPAPQKPVWSVKKSMRYSSKAKPHSEEIILLKQQILRFLP